VSTTDSEDFVTLTRFGDLTAAQLLCGRLEAEGVECFIPDEVMAAQTWHLNSAIGGIRVQVRPADLERAREILEETGRPPAAEDGAGDGDDGTISPGDRAAYRSLRVALVSLWVLGLVHPYSLWLAVHALLQKDLTGWGRWRAFVALAVSLAGCGFLAFLSWRFLILSRG
jgi:hypothetical protein